MFLLASYSPFCFVTFIFFLSGINVCFYVFVSFFRVLFLFFVFDFVLFCFFFFVFVSFRFVFLFVCLFVCFFSIFVCLFGWLLFLFLFLQKQKVHICLQRSYSNAAKLHVNVHPGNGKSTLLTIL